MKPILAMITIVSLLSSCTESSFNGGNGDNEQDSPIIVVGIDSPEEITQACGEASSELISYQQELSYPARENCSFGVAPNLETRDAFVQAFESSSNVISIPQGAVICDLSLKSPENESMHYDDFVFFTLEDQVIFGSNGLVTSRFDQVNGIYQWSWAHIAGTAIDQFEAGAYCMGDVTDCVLPAHDQEGPVDIALNSNNVAPLSLAVAGKTSLIANLIATGDNDDQDCMHSEFNVTFEIKYFIAQ